MADDVGSTFGPDSMAFLAAIADQLILSGPRGTYHLPRTAAVKVGRGNMYPWFFRPCASIIRSEASRANFSSSRWALIGATWRRHYKSSATLALESTLAETVVPIGSLLRALR